ncbi:MAG: hypothetical protein KBD76_12990 [Bacteriovorax sp.]|nr:hypothetical protein [Bacteriovorax sp.]
MKQVNGPRMVALAISLSILTGLTSINALATTQFGSACPEKFVAKVTNIEDVQSGMFPKIEVHFQVIETLRGEELASKKIQIVKDGPTQFKSGEIYTVELRESWLCSANLLTKN